MTNSQFSRLRFLAFDATASGKPRISVGNVRLQYVRSLPPGYAEVETLQIGVCSSEVLYYLRRSSAHSSRFESNRDNKKKFDYYLQQNIRAGIVSETANIAELSELLLRSMFHEGVCRITAIHSGSSHPVIPLQIYVPKTNESGRVSFARQVLVTNLEEHIIEGGFAIRNPILLCDEHSRGDNIDPETGWPHQCNRGQTSGHIPKAAAGHAELIGTAVEGFLRIPLNGLTPIPSDLQKFVEQDPVNRMCLLTAIEPLGCVFDAFGTLLQSGEIPSTIVIIGDGWSTLNTITFLQVFAPNAQIIIVGKTENKLKALEAFNPEKITTCIDGTENYGILADQLMKISGGKTCDVLLAMVPIAESRVSTFIRDGGMLIWWAARDAAFAEHKTILKRYRIRASFGGAPRAEFSAAALVDYFARERLDVIKNYLTYPAVRYLPMGVGAAMAVQDWLLHNGRLSQKVLADDGEESEMSVKLFVNTDALQVMSHY